MKTCGRMKDVETWFDTGAASNELQTHVNSCSICSEHLAFLKTTRAALRQMTDAATEHKLDVERFLTDYRDRKAEPVWGVPSRWGLVSAAAAACLVALSLLSIFTPDERSVDARSYVESVRSDVEGVTATTYHSDDGTAIVWVNVPEGDMW